MATSAKPWPRTDAPPRLDRGLGREAHVAEPVGAVEAVHAVLVVDLVRAADVLDDLEARADRDHLRGVLDVIGELLDVPVEARPDPVVAAHRSSSTMRALCLWSAPWMRAMDWSRFLPLADEEAKAELTLQGVSVEGEAGRVGAAMLAAVPGMSMRARPAGSVPAPFLNMIPAIPHMGGHLRLAFESGHDNRNYPRTATG